MLLDTIATILSLASLAFTPQAISITLTMLAAFFLFFRLFFFYNADDLFRRNTFLKLCRSCILCHIIIYFGRLVFDRALVRRVNLILLEFHLFERLSALLINVVGETFLDFLRYIFTLFILFFLHYNV